MVVYVCNLSYWRRQGRRITVLLKKQQRIGGMNQVIEHLPSKFKALSSCPSTTKKKEGRKKGRKL
jgi:hypothetical protein